MVTSAFYMPFFKPSSRRKKKDWEYNDFQAAADSNLHAKRLRNRIIPQPAPLSRGAFYALKVSLPSAASTVTVPLSGT